MLAALIVAVVVIVPLWGLVSLAKGSHTENNIICC